MGTAHPSTLHEEGTLSRNGREASLTVSQDMTPRPQRPVVCFDETSTQLLADARAPLPAAPGHPRHEDYEYRREGTRNLFLACEPLD